MNLSYFHEYCVSLIV